jgi:hypothetical protein
LQGAFSVGVLKQNKKGRDLFGKKNESSQVKFLIPIIRRAASACKQKLCVCVLGVVVLLFRLFGFRMG